MLLTHGIPLDFRGGVHLFIYNRHTPSGQSRVYQVTQLRTNDVYFRESAAGTGPVNLKVVPNECCCLGTSLSHTHYWYAVGMLKVRAHATDSVKTEYLWDINVSGLFGVNVE